MPKLLHGDALIELRGLADASVDALVTDPPAGIAFMGKRWGHDHGGREGWCGAFATIFAECLRVMKPGAHGLVWALPRTSHWTASALEDAGFEIRDVVTHHFGSGFPKSLDVSKAIDKQAGHARASESVPNYRNAVYGRGLGGGAWNAASEGPVTAAAAAAWDGWGTALKPASEHWILVRKPFRGNVAANVLQHGTGALNIDACRIATAESWDGGGPTKPREAGIGFASSSSSSSHDLGRWPANLALSHDGECVLPGDMTEMPTLVGCVSGCPVAELDRQSGELTSGFMRAGTALAARSARSVCYGSMAEWTPPSDTYGDTGGASRFFYVAKPSPTERHAGLESAEPQKRDAGRKPGKPGGENPRNRGAQAVANHHPTVKSFALMRWLCRLVTPRKGIVLDPFMGSGTTGVAALREGFDFIGIEREAEYIEIAKQRIYGDAPLFNAAALN